MKILLAAALACGACGAQPPVSQNGGESSAANYGTQSDPPIPNYAEILARPRATGDHRELDREPDAPRPADAKRIGQLWLDRLAAHEALSGMGLEGKGPDGAVTTIDTLLSRREFDDWLGRNGWVVPRHIHWRFQNELAAPSVTEAAASRIRYWPAARVRTGMQHMAALYGQVDLRDGCFFLRKFDGAKGLAWFLAETGVAIDPQGYVVLIDRANGEINARVGETMVWAGPSADPKPEQTRALRAACGEHPVYNVGNPQSHAKFRNRYPHISPIVPKPPRTSGAP